MWEIIESTIDYTTGDVLNMYIVITVIAFTIAILMYKSACNKDD